MDLFSCFLPFLFKLIFLFPFRRQKVASRAAKLGLAGSDWWTEGME